MKRLPVLILSAALLASCNEPATQPLPDPTPSLNALSGQVVEMASTSTESNLTTTPWTGGAGTIQAYLEKTDGQPFTVASAPLKADGTFNLNLPPTVIDDHLLPMSTPDPAALFVTEDATCTGTPTLSNPQARGTVLGLNVAASKQGELGSYVIRSTIDETQGTGTLNLQFGALIYVDRDTSAVGVSTCRVTIRDTYPASVSHNMNLKKGWNKVTFSTTYVLEDSGINISGSIFSGALPTDQWVLMEGTMNGLNAAALSAGLGR